MDRKNPFAMTTALHGDVELPQDAQRYRNRMLNTRLDLSEQCIGLRFLDFVSTDFCATNLAMAYPQGMVLSTSLGVTHQLVCDGHVVFTTNDPPKARVYQELIREFFDTCEVKDTTDTFDWSIFCVGPALEADVDVASERFEADGWCKLEPNLDHLLLNAEPLTADEVYDTHQSDCSAIQQKGTQG